MKLSNWANKVPEFFDLRLKFFFVAALCLKLCHAVLQIRLAFLERRYAILQARILRKQCQLLLKQGRVQGGLLNIELRYHALNLQHFRGRLPVLRFVGQSNHQVDNVFDVTHSKNPTNSSLTINPEKSKKSQEAK